MSFLYRQFYQNSIEDNNRDNRNIVFIDYRLPDSQIIAQKVAVTARVIIIGSEDDGVRIISQILQDSSCYEIHIFAKGTPGCIYLGNSQLSINTLTKYNLELSSWFNNCDLDSLDREQIPYIYLYGCDLAAGDVGEEFITKLSNITRAKVAASVSTTQSHILSEI